MSRDPKTSKSYQSAPAEMAYQILRREGRPVHYSQILGEIASIQGIDSQGSPRELARLYTDLNLDYRLNYAGAGEWGLKEWAPRAAGRASMARPAAKPKRDNRLRLEVPEDEEPQLSAVAEAEDEDEDEDEDEGEVEEGESEWDDGETEE